MINEHEAEESGMVAEACNEYARCRLTMDSPTAHPRANIHKKRSAT
ncbi:hypothetical protein ACFL5L_05295 [candidate division KSB1 bacterium]